MVVPLYVACLIVVCSHDRSLAIVARPMCALVVCRQGLRMPCLVAACDAREARVPLSVPRGSFKTNPYDNISMHKRQGVKTALRSTLVG